jgi:hypothetical protein
MKKLIVLSVIMAFMLLTWGSLAPVQPQEPTNEEKPTFYRLVPGTYVNGWPRFTIHYPKDWIERIPRPHMLFRATDPGLIRFQAFMVSAGPIPYPLDKFAENSVMFFRAIAQDVTLVSDKPSQLWDGTPAREVGINMVMNGEPLNTLALATKKDDLLICASVETRSGKIGEDLKAILYSLEFQPGKDETVTLPPDIQEFLDRHCSAMVSHDVAKVMTHYSDKYLNSGVRKGEMERFWSQYVGSVTSVEVGVTDFQAEADRVHLAAFLNWNKLKHVLQMGSIIKEKGEWKWYGNQRNPSP